ncbi:unnamed protein product [Tilletia caries]|nr:unnamed protein product [Tilletia caries]
MQVHALLWGATTLPMVHPSQSSILTAAPSPALLATEPTARLTDRRFVTENFPHSLQSETHRMADDGG